MEGAKMNEALFKKTWAISIFCIATLLFMLSIPMTSQGDDSCTNTINVNVAPNIIYTPSQGEGLAVVVHTNQDYCAVDLSATQIFVNDGNNGYCLITYFGQREDDNGHLDIYFLLDYLIECKDYLEINSEGNVFRIEGIRHDESTFCGEADMHIVGKQGPNKP